MRALVAAVAALFCFHMISGINKVPSWLGECQDKNIGIGAEAVGLHLLYHAWIAQETVGARSLLHQA